VICTYTSFEVIFGNDSLYSAYSWPDQRGCVQVVKFIERQQVWQIGKGLIADPVSVLVTLLHFINYVMAYFAILPKIKQYFKLLLLMHYCVLPNTQHKVTVNRSAVPNQKHTPFFFSHKQIRCFLSGHLPEIPAKILG
jgi:hypothetical protein